MNRTVERVVEILDLISQNERGLSLTELVEMTGYPKTSVYDILRTLEDKNMIYRYEHPANCYAIGFRVFAIGNTYQSNSHLLQNAIGEIERLGAKMNKPILLGKPYRRHVLYVGKYEPKDTLLKLPSVGERDDQTKNAMGLLFQQIGDRIQKKESSKMHECVSFGMESDSLVYSIAAPIFNFERRLSGAIMVIDFNQQRGKLGEECRELELCARKISLKMGFNSR